MIDQKVKGNGLKNALNASKFFIAQKSDYDAILLSSQYIVLIIIFFIFNQGYHQQYDKYLNIALGKHINIIHCILLQCVLGYIRCISIQSDLHTIWNLQYTDRVNTNSRYRNKSQNGIQFGI